MPGLDALSVKQNFDLRRQGSNMVFFATGPFFSDGIIKELMDCGFVYYFMKPFHPDALSRQIVSMRFAGPKSHVPNSSVHKATWILRDLGMPAHLLGFHYVRQAITLVAEDHGRYGVGMITRKLYPDIAEQNKSSASKVERAIRHAIEVVFDRSPPDKIEKYFGSTVGENRGKTTNSEFIMMLVDQIALSGGNPQIISSGVWM